MALSGFGPRLRPVDIAPAQAQHIPNVPLACEEVIYPPRRRHVAPPLTYRLDLLD